MLSLPPPPLLLPSQSRAITMVWNDTITYDKNQWLYLIPGDRVLMSYPASNDVWELQDKRAWEMCDFTNAVQVCTEPKAPCPVVYTLQVVMVVTCSTLVHGADFFRWKSLFRGLVSWPLDEVFIHKRLTFVQTSELKTLSLHFGRVFFSCGLCDRTTCSLEGTDPLHFVHQKGSHTWKELPHTLACRQPSETCLLSKLVCTRVQG